MPNQFYLFLLNLIKIIYNFINFFFKFEKLIAGSQMTYVHSMITASFPKHPRQNQLKKQTAIVLITYKVILSNVKILSIALKIRLDVK